MASDWNKLTVAQLKEELVKNGLEVSGKKSELVARIESFKMAETSEAVDAESKKEEQMETEEKATNGEAADDGKQGEVKTEEEPEKEVKEEEQESEEVQQEQVNNEGSEVAKQEAEVIQEDENDPMEDEETKPEETDGEEKEEGVNAGEDADAEKVEQGDDIGKDGEEKEGEEKEGEEKEGEEKQEEKEEEKEDDEPIIGQEDLESDPCFMRVSWMDNQVIWIPIKDQIKDEVMADTRWRTVVVFPILQDDLQNSALTDLLQRAIHFHINFKSSWSVTEKTQEGYVELIFRSFDEAKQVAEDAQKIREGIKIKHLGCNESRANVVHEWRKEKMPKEDTILSRLMYLGNLPKDMDENQLRELFPDGLRAILARKEDRELRGYGYIEFGSEEELEAELEKQKELEVDEHKICVMKCMKEKPPGMMADKERDGIVRKVRGIRSNIKFNSRTMNRNEQQYLKTLQNKLLEKLRTDTNVRKSNGLLTPDRLKKLEEREARMMKESEHKASSTGSTPGHHSRGRGGNYRGNQRGRGGTGRGMGRGGAQWSPRGGRGSFRGNWGGNQGWQGGRGGGGGQRQGEVAVAMDLLNNLSQALSVGGGGGRGGSVVGPSRYGEASWSAGYSNQGGNYGGRGGGSGFNNRGGGSMGYGAQNSNYGNQGSWNNNKRRLSNEGNSDWKRRQGDGGRRGGGGGGGAGYGGRNWNY